MYAVIETGGQQYKVKEGDTLKVERLDGDVGSKLTFDKILVIGDEGDTKLGRPYVDGARVESEIVAQDRHRKVIVFKYRRRKGYQKKQGHRQPFTKVRITKVKG
ncbi:MAG: 50S ribosomal protein L21 [Deltaproteobacteria bacterium]|nr:50S ribosomal protein L21 [Deltaproteobacteria bacterium]